VSSPSSRFVRDKFSEYYTKQFSVAGPLTSIEQREFGFLLFDKRIMLRHKVFKTFDAFHSFLASLVPSDVYYSCAYYEDPEAEMDKKGWLGADLIFDIDADHIPTPCNKTHDEWVCSSCSFAGRGIVPEKCPICGNKSFDVNTWSCDVCLDSAKTETIKLLDMLTQDFGFSEKEVTVFFSGNRGYHIHIESTAVRTMETVARKEIVDYISGLGFDTAFHGLSEKDWRTMHASRGPNINDFGWRGRIAVGIYDFISNAKEEDFIGIGLKRNVAEALWKNREAILKSWEETGPWTTVKGAGFETWKKLAEFCVKARSAKVDTVVTTDIHRLIRLTETLHSKTGLRKVESQLSKIQDFDPFKNAVAFKTGTVRVFVSDAPEFRLGDDTLGPYKNQRVELPTAAAVLLICKGRAEVLE
jgi:DNA primase small subunit